MNHVDVAVIGGGFSAAATIVNLIELLDPEQKIGVVGRSAGLGLGTAYGTTDEVHRLNVPAGRMSIFPDRPDHLCEWLARNGHAMGPEDFIPRKVFGAYVQDTLEAQLYRTDNRSRIFLQDAEAMDCEYFGDEEQVFHLSNGEQLSARASVFCIGGTPAGLPLRDDRIAPEARRHLCLNVWADKWMERARPDDTIFMLGSGLTTIDQVMSLRRRGHRGRIHIVSRHGLVPLPHQVPRSHPVEAAFSPGAGPLSAMMRKLRDAAGKAEDWRSAVDGIRPITQAVWQHLTMEERQRFMRHANTWWNIHRHRLAPDIRARFDEMRDSGQVEVHAGWLHEVYESGGQARVAYRDRHSGTLRQISADWVVNCTGMEKCSISKVPLLKKMSARGMITGDALGLGLAVNADSQIQREDGSIAAASYALGPMTIGQFFEIFAVPDIRVQTKQVAGRISEKISVG
ncbi:FAD/NAD(P)-binding protein [Rhizobium sp.]